MLRITVEIWPAGDKTCACVVAIANVANLSALDHASDYALSVTEGPNPVTNRPVWALGAKVALWAVEEAGKTGR